AARLISAASFDPCARNADICLATPSRARLASASTRWSSLRRRASVTRAARSLSAIASSWPMRPDAADLTLFFDLPELPALADLGLVPLRAPDTRFFAAIV